VWRERVAQALAEAKGEALAGSSDSAGTTMPGVEAVAAAEAAVRVSGSRAGTAPEKQARVDVAGSAHAAGDADFGELGSAAVADRAGSADDTGALQTEQNGAE
jgi:hypothetical protein